MLGASTILFATPLALGYARASRRSAPDRGWATAALVVALVESAALALAIAAWGYYALWW